MGLTPLIPNLDPNGQSKLPSLSSLQPSIPPPMDDPLSSGGMPSLPATLKPLVQPGGNALQRIMQEQQYSQEANTHQGLTHSGAPAQGFWQHLGKIAEGIGNVAGDVFDPAGMALIPGTQLNRRITAGQGAAGLAGLEKQDTEEQDAASQRALQSAQTGEAGAREQAIENPPPKPVDLAQAYANAVQSAISAGKDPSTDPVVGHLADAITNIQKQPAAKTPEAPKTIQVEVGGRPHQMAWDDKTGKYDLDQGESGEKPATVNVNSGEAALDRESSRFAKNWETASTGANAQLDKITDAANMIGGNAESQALGIPKVLTALVGGQGTGVRITTPELNAIAKARGWAGDFEGTLNKISGKGQLAPMQQQQLSQILNDVKQRLVQKQQIANDALDRINGGASRQEIIQSDKEARQKLAAFERGEGGGGIQVKTPDGKSYSFQDQAAADRFKAAAGIK